MNRKSWSLTPTPSLPQVGKVEEIFGGVSNAFFTIKMGDGVVATSYKAGDKFYIDPMKLLPLERFLPQPKGAGGRGGGRGEKIAFLRSPFSFAWKPAPGSVIDVQDLSILLCLAQGINLQDLGGKQFGEPHLASTGAGDPT